MNEKIFWELIEESWSTVPNKKKARMMIAKEKEFPEESTDLGRDLEKAIEEKVFPHLEKILNKLSKRESFSFNRILEKKLYDLDNKEIYNFIGGSDDGFLYHRGFIVGMGKKYYYSILNKPSMATFLLSSENFAYMTRAIHCNLHESGHGIGNFNEGISRESHSNKEGWN